MDLRLAFVQLQKVALGPNQELEPPRICSRLTVGMNVINQLYGKSSFHAAPLGIRPLSRYEA